ncbi:hypothetical protein ACUOFC_60460, partial [Escherichia sp. TWPC-MK]
IGAAFFSVGRFYPALVGNDIGCGMAFFVFVVVLLTLEDDTRQALLVTPLWFIALGLGWLFIGKKRAAELRK